MEKRAELVFGDTEEMSLRIKVSSFIKEFELISNGDSVLLGVSGGPDSVFMLHILNELKEEMGFSISVASFNHKLREEASDECDFVRKMSSELGVPFFYGEANVKKVSEEKKISIEEAARAERFRFLFNLKEEKRFDKIALAHNKDDFVETVLIHLLKGSGLNGLTGIKPASFNGIIHPILPIGREELAEYLRENKILYRTDLTNYSLAYLRNKIRHQIVPLFTAMNENFKERVFRMGLLLLEEDRFLSDIVKKDIEIIRSEGGFSVRIFLSLPLFEKRRIIKLLLGDKAGFDRIERIIKFLETPLSNKMSLYGNLFLIKNGGYFYVREDKAHPFSVSARYTLNIPCETVIKEISAKIITEITNDFRNFRPSKETAVFDFDKLPLPLVVRFRNEGDKIRIENGTKKLQDLFVDLKVPLEKRPYVPILTDAKGNIIWVIGIRRSALYKTDSSTKNALIVRYSKIPQSTA